MKTILVFVLLLANCLTGFAQPEWAPIGAKLEAQPPEFRVDCGNDTVFCPRLYPDTIFHIGTKVKFFNGNPPYTFQWSCRLELPYSHYVLTASNFLNDPRILNPYIKTIMDVGVTFHLYVRDRDGNMATDSIFINATRFIYSLGEYSFFMHLGDSLQLSGHFVGGGIPPVKYYWTPSEGLSDSASIDTWCSPQKSTAYYQYIIDSAGCKCNPNRAYNIYILPTSVKNINKSENVLNLHQNGERLIFNNPYNKSANLSFFSMDGKKIYTTETNDSFFDIPCLLIKSSIKICVLSLDGSIVSLKVY